MELLLSTINCDKDVIEYMYRHYNPNPDRRNVGDCAIRAVAAACGLTWTESYDALCEMGRIMHDMPSANIGEDRMAYNLWPYNPGQTMPSYYPGYGTLQQNVVWVQGEEAAKAYLVAAGNTVLLMDSEQNRFYLKTTDSNGMPQKLRVFEFVELTEEQPKPTKEPEKTAEEYATLKAFQALSKRVRKLEQRFEEDAENESYTV